MIEKTLEEYIEDFQWCDPVLLPREYKLQKEKQLIQRFQSSIVNSSDTQEVSCINKQQIRDQYIDIGEELRLLIGFGNTDYETTTCLSWKECIHVVRKVFGSRVLKNFYEYTGIDDINTCIKTCEPLIKVILLYTAIDYLYRFDEHKTEFGQKYVRSVLESGLPKQLSWVRFNSEEYDGCLDIQKDGGKEYASKLSVLYGKVNAESVKTGEDLRKAITKASKAVYDRVRDKKRTNSNSKGVQKRYDNSEPVSFNPYIICKDPNLFFREVIGFSKRMMSKDEDDNSKFRVLSFMDVLPLILMESDKEMPDGPYVKNGGLTYERIQHICEVVEKYKKFPGASINGYISDEKKAEKLKKILLDWACEDCFHLDRLDAALTRSLDWMKKIDRSSQNAQITEKKILKLYSIMTQVPYYSLIGYKTFDDVAEAIIAGNPFPEKQVRRIFAISNILFPQLITICVNLLFTNGKGEIKSRGELMYIISNLADEVIADPFRARGKHAWDYDPSATLNQVNDYYDYSVQSKNRDYGPYKVVYFNPRFTNLSVSEVTKELIRQDGNICNYMSLMDIKKLDHAQRINMLCVGKNTPERYVVDSLVAVNSLVELFRENQRQVK